MVKAAKKRRRKPAEFKLSEREIAILQNWETTHGLSPKLTAVVDSCALATVYQRLAEGAIRRSRMAAPPRSPPRRSSAAAKACHARNISRRHYWRCAHDAARRPSTRCFPECRNDTRRDPLGRDRAAGPTCGSAPPKRFQSCLLRSTAPA